MTGTGSSAEQTDGIRGRSSLLALISLGAGIAAWVVIVASVAGAGSKNGLLVWANLHGGYIAIWAAGVSCLCALLARRQRSHPRYVVAVLYSSAALFLLNLLGWILVDLMDL